jgi:hypothetical protein
MIVGKAQAMTGIEAGVQSAPIPPKLTQTTVEVASEVAPEGEVVGTHAANGMTMTVSVTGKETDAEA